MTSSKQVEANRANAQLSTGPRTAEGKEAASGNRITHGILATKLLLAGEQVEDYQALLGSLQAELKPVGTLELTLVEKLAVILWRQRRLVGAETSTIALALTDKRIANEVGSGLGISEFGYRAINTEDLDPPDEEQVTWCKAVIAEYEAAEVLSLSDLEKKAPLIYKQLAGDAEQDQESISEYISNSDDKLAKFAMELVSWCRKELEKAEKYPLIQSRAIQAKNKFSIPWGKLDLFSKYQAALDNQLYKAMRALREAQDWRMKTIEGSTKVACMGLYGSTCRHK